MRKRIVGGLIALLLLIPTGCGSRVVDRQQVAKDEKVVIKFSHVVAENTPKGLAAKRFADLVRERTGGYVEVQVFPNSQMFKDGEELEALQRGDVQIIAPATSKLSELSPQWQILDLPFAFPDLGSFHALVDGPVGQELFAKLREQKMVGLAMWDNGFKQVTTNRRPLITPEDLRGLSFRIMSSNILKQQFELLGATATPLPFNDVYNALETGQVDSQENTISNIYTQKFDQVQNYLTLSNHGYLSYVVLTNAEFWDSLDPKLRKILEDTMAEVTVWERKKALELNEAQLEEIRKDGRLKIYTLNESQRLAWQNAFEPVYAKLASEIGVDLISAVKRLRNKGD